MLQAYQTTQVVPPDGQLLLKELSPFCGQRVHVIVLGDTEEEDESQAIDRQERYLEILRSMPAWAEEDIQRIEEATQWQPPSF